jgi:Secretion system C-terminal sorting domain
MKKIYTLLAATMMVGVLSAQVTLFQDNFDGYAYGSGPVANDPVNWSYWSTANSDAFIDTAYAFSGTNSCRIQNQTTDLVLPIGPFTGGRYALDFQMLIPSGSTGAYFNALHDWSATQTTYEWGMDVFFDGTGAVSYTVGFVNEVPGYTVPVGEWFDVKMVYYLDVDSVALIMQGDTLFKKQWSLNNADGTAGLNQIAGVDFFGTDAGNTDGWYYIDDVTLTDVSNVSVQENALSSIAVFPNPASNQFMIKNDFNTNAQLWIYNAQGQLIFNHKMNQPVEVMSVSDWADGVYQLVLQSGSRRETRHLLVQH